MFGLGFYIITVIFCVSALIALARTTTVVRRAEVAIAQKLSKFLGRNVVNVLAQVIPAFASGCMTAVVIRLYIPEVSYQTLIFVVCGATGFRLLLQWLMRKKFGLTSLHGFWR